MNIVSLVPRIMDARRNSTQPHAGKGFWAMFATTLQRATGCDCSYVGCGRKPQWAGSVTITARAPRGGLLLTLPLPPVCDEHAMEVSHGGPLPAALAYQIRCALANAGYGPAQASSEIDLRAA